MIAFVAWTPLHIINIINTKVNFYEKEEADLFIYNEFVDSFELYSNLKKKSMFKNVYYIDHKKKGGRLRSYYNVLKNKNQLIDIVEPFSYSEIFTQGGNYFLKILFGQTKMNNPNVRLNYIEDGIASYTTNNLLNISHFRKKIMNILNPQSMFAKKIDTYFVYQPDLSNIREKNKIKKLPIIDCEGETFKIIKDIFCLPDKLKKINADVIFLDQPFEADKSSISERHVLSFVMDLVNQDKIKIKLHPRSNSSKYNNKVEIFDSNLPWELCFLVYDLRETWIISSTSTASFTPNMIFERHSNVILLSKLILENKLIQKKDKATIQNLESVSQFTMKYNQSVNNPIHLPENKDELRRLLEEK